ncbi:SH3 domain protein [Ceratobasidium sp. AG-Ba]|nr:SH3 domain protein [Ceratobasidium sp. AG-Ba]
MAPLARRQLGDPFGLSQAFESRLSTASTAFFGPPTPVVAPTPTVPVQPTTPVAPQPQPTNVQTTPLETLTQPTVPTTTNIVSQATNVPTISSPVSSPPASTSAVSAGAGTGAQTSSDKGMSGGIIALIVVGALLAALLAGAFAFRRVQVHRRAKRRANNYGAGPIPDDAPFPFTNVSESDMKGAEPITRDFRQGSVPSINEKPLPSIAPAMPTYAGNVNFSQPGFDSGMSGPYPAMGPGGVYGYEQPGRMASPAPQAPRTISPAPPPAAVVRAGSPPFPGQVVPNQYPQTFAPVPAPTPPPAPVPAPAPGDVLPPHLRGKKRVLQTFQPSLPDELDIREGDWVTIVHAYDDGWGLCERNGRRGVVPLECLDIGKPDLRASRRLSSLSAVRQ